MSERGGFITRLNLKRNTLFLVLAGVAFLLLFVSLAPQEGLIGHDYRHQFTRTLLHTIDFWQNGFGVHHYTPSLCGGLPLFADPQSSQFSIPQFLSLFFDPWISVRITFLLFFVLGYLGMFFFAKRAGQLSTEWSHLAALFYSLNGFLFAHLFVGHLTHHSYTLLPGILTFLWPSRSLATELRFRIPLLSLACLYLVWSGGVHMVCVTIAASVVAAPFAWAHIQPAERKSFGVLIAVSAGLVLIGSLGKISAALAYSSHFFAGSIDRSAENPLTVLFRYFWFLPNRTPPSLPFGRLQFGAWEYIGFVSKLLIPGLVIATVRLGSLRLLLKLLPAFLIALLALGIGNEFIPFIRGYHNPIKLLGAFIPLLILVGVWGLARVASTNKATWMIGTLAIISLVEASSYVHYFVSQRLGLSYKYQPILSRALLEERSLPPVREVIRDNRDDLSGLARQTTSLGCYEPLLGYRNENLRSELILGPIEQEHESALNLNHPGCLVYPDYFQCAPWDRFTDHTTLLAFAKGDRVLSVPFWQSFLIWLGLIVILALCGALSLFAWQMFAGSRKSD